MNPLKLPLPELILRIGVAVAFLFPPIHALFYPDGWIGYFPKAIQLLPVDMMVVLHAFGLLETVIALWVLFGKRIFIPSVLATLILLVIVLVRFDSIEVLFRDLSIACASLALAVMHRRPQSI